MEFQVHSIHFDADAKLINHVTERMNKLDVFFDQITDGEVFLRLDKSDNNENKITEIKLNVPGKELFAKKQCKSFEEATDTAIEALRQQLQKHKEKIKG
ncbi:MAG: ribosome-associated translation inhibitor RaiA [Bacteroidota bacterium]